jgi:hypothetical protein
LPTLSAKLVADFGNGFSARNLARMVRFAEVFPDRRVVATLSRHLGWSHFVEIIYLPNDLQRDFYAEMCRVERWSVRTLRAKVQSMRRHAQIPADLPAERVGNLRMSRHGGASAVGRVAPPRMPAALADQGAAVPAQVLQVFVALHPGRLTSS